MSSKDVDAADTAAADRRSLDARRNISPCAASAAGPYAAEPPFNRTEALAYLKGEERFLTEMVTLFLQESSQLLVTVRQAIAAGDASTLQRAAHTLKGALTYVAAHPAQRAAQRLEALGAAGNMAAATPALAQLESEMERLTSALRAAGAC